MEKTGVKKKTMNTYNLLSVENEKTKVKAERFQESVNMVTFYVGEEAVASYCKSYLQWVSKAEEN
jgi:hypothetical protein